MPLDNKMKRRLTTVPFRSNKSQRRTKYGLRLETFCSNYPQLSSRFGRKLEIELTQHQEVS